MMKYPIGIQSFDRIIEDGFVSLVASSYLKPKESMSNWMNS